MRNRAKCKLCKVIIESKDKHDYVSCTCGEISVDGGNSYYKASAKDYANFLRIDDAGEEIEVKYVEKPGEVPVIAELPPLTKADHMKMLDDMIQRLEEMPEAAMRTTIDQYDFYSFLVLARALLKAES